MESKEKHVYLVRHGEAEHNVGEKIELGAVSMLTENGRQQAEIVAARVAKLNVQALVASTWPRALDTAAAILKVTELTVEPSNLFVEWGEASGILHKPQNHPETQTILRAIHEAEDHDYRHSDEETFTELKERGEAALELLKQHSADRICVVTHGAFIKALLGIVVFREAFTRKEFSSLFRNTSSTNTGITYLRYEPERGWRLITWNDSAHLG